MNERCLVCNLKFEREEGYFLGAMIISYVLGSLLIILLAAIVWLFSRWEMQKTFITAIVLFVPTAPALSSISRVLYIYFDRSIDPDER